MCPRVALLYGALALAPDALPLGMLEIEHEVITDLELLDSLLPKQQLFLARLAAPSAQLKEGVHESLLLRRESADRSSQLLRNDIWNLLGNARSARRGGGCGCRLGRGLRVP